MTAPNDPHSRLPGARPEPPTQPVPVAKPEPPPLPPPGRLDPAFDPDRYDPARESLPPDPVAPGLMDWIKDPDRYDASQDPDRPAPQPRQPLVLGRTGGTRQTLPDLLAEGSYDDKPSPYMFLLGLLGIFSFLLLVAFIFSNLEP